MLSKKAKYALKALLALAAQAGPEPMRIADLARRQRIPRKFLELILLELRNEGVVQSRRGPAGGYLLARRSDRIYLGQVVRLFDGPLAPVPCASQHFYQRCKDCPDEGSCGVRLAMKQVRDASARILDHTTVASLVRRQRAARTRRR
jgi:Rrf2 family protein